MSALLRFARLAYRTLTSLYPSGYHREYADELYLVFDQALQDAARQGFPAALRFIGRELRDLPGALTRQNILERNLTRGISIPSRFHFERCTSEKKV